MFGNYDEKHTFNLKIILEFCMNLAPAELV